MRSFSLGGVDGAMGMRFRYYVDIYELRFLNEKFYSRLWRSCTHFGHDIYMYLGISSARMTVFHLGFPPSIAL